MKQDFQCNCDVCIITNLLRSAITKYVYLIITKCNCNVIDVVKPEPVLAIFKVEANVRVDAPYRGLCWVWNKYGCLEIHSKAVSRHKNTTNFNSENVYENPPRNKNQTLIIVKTNIGSYFDIQTRPIAISVLSPQNAGNIL